MSQYNKWRCPRCNYTNDTEVMTSEARLYYAELKPGMQKLILDLFKICNKYCYGGTLNKKHKSKFIYTIGATKDLKNVIHGINIYMSGKMYKKGFTLDYLAAIIRNNAERKEIMIKAERKTRGIDPPGDK